jgi:hypothetical protein
VAKTLPGRAVILLVRLETIRRVKRDIGIAIQTRKRTVVPLVLHLNAVERKVSAPRDAPCDLPSTDPATRLVDEPMNEETESDEEVKPKTKAWVGGVETKAWVSEVETKIWPSGVQRKA